MGHGHSHGPSAAESRSALRLALVCTVLFGVAQVVAGVAFSSLALLADAAHNVSDGAAIGLALFAAWAAGLAPRGAMTFGWKRVEILAALVNGATLLVVAAWVGVEAYHRLQDPPDIVGRGVLVFGLLGIVANGLPVVVLWRRADASNLNIRAALVHAGADVLGSAATAVAGAIVLVTGWRAADPLIGVAIALLIALSAWPLVRDAVRILLEAAPRGLDVAEIGRAIAGTHGVVEAHDLHVWTITSGLPALSAHLVIRAGHDQAEIRGAVEEMLHERFGIEHTTIQTDRDAATGLTIAPVGVVRPARRPHP